MAQEPPSTPDRSIAAMVREDMALSASYLAQNHAWAVALDTAWASAVGKIEERHGRRLDLEERERIHERVRAHLDRHKPVRPQRAVKERWPIAPDHLSPDESDRWHRTQRVRVRLFYSPEAIKAAGLWEWATAGPSISRDVSGVRVASPLF